HTLVARMVSEGKLTPEQAETHPQRSMLTRALGAERDIQVDELEIPLHPGDRLLLCSDGLTAMLSDVEIRELAQTGSDLQEVCDHLVDEANARGGVDNITVVVVDVSGTVEGAAHRARPRAAGARRMPRRLLVWLGVIVIVAFGGFFGVRAWANNSYYVGVDGDHVVIYRGLPVSFAGMHMSKVYEPTTVPTERVAAYFIQHLRDGETATSLDDARAKVMQIPLIASPSPSPTAQPGSKPSPTTKATP
ncbi:MAG: SpoIIE family protein phosphatase, partial [Actinobacteria bacterium]|nr:SpoIIE family protein phosphatase [Actinomycetota bacterium]